MGDFVSVLTPFMAVIAVIFGAYAAARWAAKRRAGGSKPGKYIKIVERAALGKDTQLAVVQVGTKTMLISSAGQRVDALCELEPEELKIIEARPAEKSFMNLLNASLFNGGRDIRKK